MPRLQLKRNKLFLIFALVFSSALAHGELSKTYPTDPVTQLRWDSYVDAIVQVASTPAAGPFQVARPFKAPMVPLNLPVEFQWLYVSGDTATVQWLLPDSTNVLTGQLGVFTPATSSYAFTPTTFTMLQVLKTIRDNTKDEDINIISDQMEEYMIWPGTDVAHMYVQDSTTTIDPLMWPPVGGWKGYCFQVINGNNVAVNCPPQ